MHPLRLAPVVVSVALATGCNDKTLPAAPSGSAAPAVTGLAISGVDTFLTGFSYIYVATATLSDGTTRTVAPMWTSSNPAVGGVDGGRLDGRAHGSTTLTASYEGRSATKTVQVVNNYGGSWDGRYVVKACDHSGELRWCQGRVGNVGPVSLTLSQTGSNQSEISGTVLLEELGIREDITGVVTADGGLILHGISSITDWDGEIWGTLQVGWETNLSGPGAMTGRWTQNIVLNGRTGNAYQENELVTMTQTSTRCQPCLSAQ
jgi:hypothetical protein